MKKTVIFLISIILGIVISEEVYNYYKKPEKNEFLEIYANALVFRLQMLKEKEIASNSEGGWQSGTDLKSNGSLTQNFFYNGTGLRFAKKYCNITHHSLSEERKCQKGLHVKDNSVWGSN